MNVLRSLPGLLLMLIVLVSACGQLAQIPDTPAMPTEPPPAPASAGTKDQIVLAIGGESEEGYDPTLGWGRYGSPLFQSTLLRRDEHLAIVNDLATKYTLSEDRRVWTVTIRKDAQFSDGEPVTAEDVAYTFNTTAKSAGLTDLTMLDEAVATGTYTVELRLKEPQSTFINRLITLGIVPKHAHGADYARHPIGSGPYKLVQWNEGEQLIVEANPRYYGEQPAIKRLVFLFIDNAGDAAYAAARAGQVQVASVPQALAAQPIAGMKMYHVKSVDNRGLMFPFVHNTGAQTDKGAPIGNDVTADPAIRQAINYAIDRQALVAGVLEGFGSPAYGPVSGLAWDEPAADIQDTDMDRAREILAAGGWQPGSDGILEKDGLKAHFTLIYPASDRTRQALALSVADMIRPLGLDVEVEGKSWDDIEGLMHSNVILFGWGSHDQTEMYNLYHSSSAQGGYYNAGYYANATVDDVLDLAMGAPSEEEALTYWKAAQWDGQTGFTTKGDAAWAWLVNLDHTYFVDECLDIGTLQIEPHGHGWPITAGITSWKWICDAK